MGRLHLLDGLAIAVLNIDEIIEVIRTSDTADAARDRLRKVFDLSELQSDYILELRLRRLTRFSLIELETEADTLRKEIANLQQLLGSDELVKRLVSKELDEVAEEFGDARRTQLIDSEGVTVSRKPVQVAQLEDSPATVYLDAMGNLFRSEPSSQSQSRSGSFMSTSLRKDVGLVTSRGRILRVHVSDLPAMSAGVSTTASSADKSLGLSGESVVGMADWLSDATYAIGTNNGVVKRLTGPFPDKDEVEVIGLKEGDKIVAFSIAEDGSELCFVTSNANVLIFPAASVRPQGLSAGGMSGITASNSRVISFGVVDSDTHLVTAANSSLALGSTDPGSIKITPVANYPRKGRATQGVRCHRFLKNQDQLYFAGFCSASPMLLNLDGSALAAVEIEQRRDGSGIAVDDYLAAAF